MRQAISTRYVGPTNYRGARVIATAGGGLRLTLSWDYALNQQRNHQAAARALADRLQWGWGPHWAGGGTKDGYCFVDSSDGQP